MQLACTSIMLPLWVLVWFLLLLFVAVVKHVMCHVVFIRVMISVMGSTLSLMKHSALPVVRYNKAKLFSRPTCSFNDVRVFSFIIQNFKKFYPFSIFKIWWPLTKCIWHILSGRKILIASSCGAGFWMYNKTNQWQQIDNDLLSLWLLVFFIMMSCLEFFFQVTWCLAEAWMRYLSSFTDHIKRTTVKRLSQSGRQTEF